VPGLAAGLFYNVETVIVADELRGARLRFPREGFVCMGVPAAHTE
jgi:hypothetical protein